MNEIHEFKSDSKGTSLITHLKAVEKIALILSDRLGLKDDMKSIISKSALLHDLGKICDVFSLYIDNKVATDKFIDDKVYHNEISWAVLSLLLGDDYKNRDIILHSVYWHHPRRHSNVERDNVRSILTTLSMDDKSNCVELYNYLTGENKVIDGLIIQDDENIPKYIDDADIKHYSKKFLSLSCLISADRYVSSNDQQRILNDDSYCNQIIDNVSMSTIDRNYIIPEFYDFNRFKQQEDYAKEALLSNTNIIKMPAGGGKTLIGILNWLIGDSKKLIWVCPRNAIAESVYRSVIVELNNLKIKANVELYLAGNIVNKNYDCSSDGFKSDIVITNIDNFLNPNVTNWVMDRMFPILHNNVIFDEFHEFISDAPLFALFNETMKIRHKYTNSKTILLSATPSIMNDIWDSPKHKTTILPNKESHYKAVHSKEININIIENINCIKPENNTVLITNAIESAQKLAIKDNYSIIAHSQYLPEKRKEIIDNIYKLYGKDNKGLSLDKVSVISAPIIQAAMDISFNKMNEIVFSPESTVQRIGRLNRWAEYEYSILNMILNNNGTGINKNEASAINLLYDKKLNDKWVKFIKKNINKKTFILDEIYILYNKFNDENNNDIINYIRLKNIQSMKSLSKIYPKRYVLDDNDSELDDSKDDFPLKPLSTKNSLRCDVDDEDIYVIYKKYDNNEYTDVFSTTDSDDIDGKDFIVNESDLINIIKNLSTDKRFDYDKYKTFKNPNFNSKKLKRMAWNEKTPYVIFNKVYHEKLGVVRKEIIKK